MARLAAWKVGCRVSLKVPAFLKIEPFNDGIGDPVAPLTRERKQVPEARSDVFGQGLLEQPSGAMQPCLDGFRLQIEGCGRLLNAHAFDNPGDEDRAKLARKRVDRAFDELTELLLCHGPFRIDR